MITSVTNNNGGTKTAPDFKTHVTANGVDVGQSPQNGSATRAAARTKVRERIVLSFPETGHETPGR